MTESCDQEYTEYLKKLLNRLIQERYQVDLLNVELDRSYQMYQKRMGMDKVNVPSDEEPKTTDAPWTTETDKAETASEGNRYFNMLDEQPMHAATQAHVTTPIEEVSVIAAETMPEMLPEPETASNQAPAMWQPQVQKSQKKKNAEFTIGAAVLSVVGGAFILAALVTLGMTFMSGFFKGICLYGIALAFLLVSELGLYRRWSMLGTTISAIGIGGLYLSTAVNYLGLHNFNMWVTLVISFGITGFTIFLSRKRDSITYRIIGMIAGYLCFFTVREGITDTEFLVISGMILLMNLMVAMLPVKKAGTALNITHMTANAIFAIAFMCYAIFGCYIDYVPLLIFALGAISVQLLLLVLEFGKRGEQAEILATFYLSTFFQVVFTMGILSYLVEMEELGDGYCFICHAVVLVIGLLAIGALCFRKCGGWQHIYIFMNMMTFFIYMCALNAWVTVCGLVLLVVISKLVSWKDTRALRVNDMITTVVLCLCVAFPDDGAQIYVLLAGLLFSVVMIRYWQTAYEILLTFTLVFYVAEYLNLPVVLQLPMVVGILLVGILVFNNVKRWHGKHILVFNVLALAGQVVCFLGLMNPIYQNAYIMYLCMLVFGLATIVITFQEKYHLNFKGKQMVLAVFLTYMALVFKTSLPVINSVLLMVIALVSVGIGFVTDKKSVRIYGLMLSLFVCGKLVLYDFFKAPTLQKTILFFGVGAIALIISTIYIVLEKKNSHVKEDGVE